MCYCYCLMKLSLQCFTRECYGQYQCQSVKKVISFQPWSATVSLFAYFEQKETIVFHCLNSSKNNFTKKHRIGGILSSQFSNRLQYFGADHFQTIIFSNTQINVTNITGKCRTMATPAFNLHFPLFIFLKQNTLLLVFCLRARQITLRQSVVPCSELMQNNGGSCYYPAFSLFLFSSNKTQYCQFFCLRGRQMTLRRSLVPYTKLKEKTRFCFFLQTVN